MVRLLLRELDLKPKTTKTTSDYQFLEKYIYFIEKKLFFFLIEINSIHKNDILLIS